MSFLLVVSGASGAEPVTLATAALKETVTGATVHLDTPLGTVLPLVFHPDGVVTGTAGRLSFYLGSASDRGKWWVANGRLCQKWNKWFDAETSCMQIHKDGAKFRWQRDDGKSGMASITSRSPPKSTEPPGLPAAAPVTTASAVPAPPSLQNAPPVIAPAPLLLVERVLRPAASRVAVGPVVRAVGEPAPGAPTSVIAPVIRAGAVYHRVVGVRSDDVLNLRALPSADAHVVGTVPWSGRNVALMGACQGAWCRVRYGKTMGWANVAYLEREAAMATEASR